MLKSQCWQACFETTATRCERNLRRGAAPPSGRFNITFCVVLKVVLAAAAKRSMGGEVTPAEGMLMLLARASHAPYTGARKAIG
jgi:hypothetical protein